MQMMQVPYGGGSVNAATSTMGVMSTVGNAAGSATDLNHVNLGLEALFFLCYNIRYVHGLRITPRHQHTQNNPNDNQN